MALKEDQSREHVQMIGEVSLASGISAGRTALIGPSLCLCSIFMLIVTSDSHLITRVAVSDRNQEIRERASCFSGLNDMVINRVTQ